VRRHLKNAFNKCAKKTRRTLAALTAGFILATGAGAMPPAAAAVLDGVTYWQGVDADVVYKMQPCAENGLCMSIHHINPADPKVKELLVTLKNIMAQSADWSSSPTPQDVSDENVLSFCQYNLQTRLEEASTDDWRGTVVSPFNHKKYDIRVAVQEDGILKLSGYLTSWLRIPLASFKMQRINSLPPAACSGYPPVDNGRISVAGKNVQPK